METRDSQNYPDNTDTISKRFQYLPKVLLSLGSEVYTDMFRSERKVWQ